MISLVMLAVFSLQAQAAPDYCHGKMCDGWVHPGLSYDKYCDVTKDNLLLTIPPSQVTTVHQCEGFSEDLALSKWYNYRQNGECELLSFCKEMIEEKDSVTGPDPGNGQSCFEVALVIGGTTGAVISSVDVITEDLEVISGIIPDIPEPGRLWTAGLVDDLVLVCGAYDSNGRDCQQLNMTTRTWTTTSRMAAQRTQAASVTHDGSMYVFGGGNTAILSTVEQYDISSNSWSAKNDWRMPETAQEFCAVKHNEYIYHIGGLDEFGGRDMRRLSTVTSLYESMPSMLDPRRRHACLVISIGGDEGILVSGGYDAGQALNTAEFYSFTTQEWKRLPKMTVRRQLHGMLMFQGLPVAFGGSNSGTDSYRDSFEAYDDTTSQWVAVEGTKLAQPKEGFAYLKVPQWDLTSP